MSRRHAVQVLLEAGHQQREIETITGISERSVRRIGEEQPVSSFDDAQERKRRGIGRPSKVERWRQPLADILKAEPALATKELLRRMTEDGYGGSKTQFYALVRELRPKDTRPEVRFEGLAGEFSQHDFGQVDVRFLDGSVRRVHFFASRLKYSRMARVTMVQDEKVESLVRSLVDHFAYFGGVTLMAVFDRPKTVALKWDKDGTVTQWNTTFLQVMAELGVAPEVCWPYRANQKGSVENLVGWVKSSFFKVRCFLDDEDLLRQLEAWHQEVNCERPSRATGEVPMARMEASETKRLRPLKVSPDELLLRYPIQVGPTAMVRFETCLYSMPPQAIALTGTLYLRRDSLRIVAGRWSAEHPRLRVPYSKSVLPEHRVAMVAAVSGQRGRDYLKRQQLLDLGPVMYEYLTELVHRRQRTWKSDVHRMHEMLCLHGDEEMLAAVQKANAQQTYGAEYVDHYLDKERLVRAIFQASEALQ